MRFSQKKLDFNPKFVVVWNSSISSCFFLYSILYILEFLYFWTLKNTSYFIYFLRQKLCKFSLKSDSAGLIGQIKKINFWVEFLKYRGIFKMEFLEHFWPSFCKLLKLPNQCRLRHVKSRTTFFSHSFEFFFQIFFKILIFILSFFLI